MSELFTKHFQMSGFKRWARFCSHFTASAGKKRSFICHLDQTEQFCEKLFFFFAHFQKCHEYVQKCKQKWLFIAIAS